MEVYETILWTLLVVAGLGAAIIHFIRLSKDTASDLKEEQERKKHPLSKIEIAARQAERRKAKEEEDANS